MDPILVKHELNMLCNLLSVWKNFEADTLKHFEKKVQKTLQRQRLDCDETQTSCVVQPWIWK